MSRVTFGIAATVATVKCGYTVPSLKLGSTQRAKVRDVFVSLGYAAQNDKFKVSVYTMENITSPLFSQEFVSVREARANFAHQLHRHFAQQLKEIKQDRHFGTCRELTGNQRQLEWVCRYKGEEYGRGSTKEEAQLRGWEKMNPPPITEKQAKYEHYWSRPGAPKFLSYHCPHCSQVLKTYRPAYNQTCDTMVECPFCDGHFKIDVSHRRVESTSYRKQP